MSVNQLQRVFDYDGQQVRTAVIDGQPWFVAKDVCDILELGNVAQAVSRLDEDEKGVTLNDTPDGGRSWAGSSSSICTARRRQHE